MLLSKRFFIALAVLIFSCQGVFAVALADSAKPLRLFLIGNSFSQNASQFLPQIVKEGGHSLVIGRAELGGCPLNRHWELVEANDKNPDDPKGKPYGGKSLRELLGNGTWDVVTIQQYSLFSSNLKTYQPYAEKLYRLIKALQPAAKIYFHQTWAYRTDSKDFGQTGDSVSAKSSKEMWEKSRSAYNRVADQLKIDILPVGDAFWMVNSDRKYSFKADPTYNFAHPEYPALPVEENSLHVGYTWNAEKKLGFDSHHANQAGCYLGALVWYRFLFNEDPRKVNFKPEKVPEAFAAFIRETAAKVRQPKYSRDVKPALAMMAR